MARGRGPLGANLRRLRGYARPVPAADRDLVAGIESGRVVPSAQTLAGLCRRLGLGLPEAAELEAQRRRALGLARVRPGRHRAG